jgi:general secretion pathway protein G
MTKCTNSAREKMTKLPIISTFFLASLVTACKPATQVPSLDHVYKVEEFDRDYLLRHRTLTACESNPGQLKDDANCINAFASRMGAGGQQDHQNAARSEAARQDIGTIMQALKLYRLDNGAYPSQAQGLQALIGMPTLGPKPSNWKDGGYLTNLPNDPWSNPYQYLNPGVHGEIDVYSCGAAGSVGDCNATAIGSWQ